MKLFIGVLMWGAGGACAAGHDVCSPQFFDAAPAQRVEAMRAPVREAIYALDNARIALPSPSIASGNINHITIAPNFLEQVAHVCVLGYFELRRNGVTRALPLAVEHIEVLKLPAGAEPEQNVLRTRIYFHTPRIEDFENGSDLKRTWKFWERNQTLRLRIAAFPYNDGQRGPAYFGHGFDVRVSGKSPSMCAAALFALLFYLLAAATVPVLRPRERRLGSAWRSLVRLAQPWRIVGTNGQASLSQLQMLLFTLIVATLLFYQWLRTGLLQQISTDLLYLIGLSTAGAAGSQISSTLKKELEPGVYHYLQQLGWFNAPARATEHPAVAAELLMTNKRFDIYKFQMLVFTFVIAAYVLASGADELGNIQISATLLTLMGMSQGAYIGGRAAIDSLTPLQDQVRGMRALHERCLACTDAALGAELRRRFAVAAAGAAALFGNLYWRALPDALLEMPSDAPPPETTP